MKKIMEYISNILEESVRFYCLRRDTYVDRNINSKKRNNVLSLENGNPQLYSLENKSNSSQTRVRLPLVIYLLCK